MKKSELEQRISEVSELRAAVEKTLTATLEDAKRADMGKEEAFRVLGEVLNFAKETLDTSQRASEADRLKFLDGAFQKLRGWAQAEGDRMKTRPQLLQERAAALQSIMSYFDDRSKSHQARIEAIERAADQIGRAHV